MKIRRAVTLFMCVLLVTLLLPVQALAASIPDAGRAVSMKITYGYKGVPLTGAQFDIYLVAERNNAGALTITEAFEEYPVKWFGEDVDLSALANTLVGYVQADNLVPTASGLIDGVGLLQFNSAEHGLKQGRYLVVPNRFDTATHIYQSQPFLLDLPGQVGEEEWLYEVELLPKPQAKPKGAGGEPITRKVLKVWDDEGYEHLRAAEVVIHLLRDGTVYDTVILNDDNNWRHTWDNLDSSYAWTVVEGLLELHTVKIEKVGITFVVTNSYEKPPVVTPTPTPTPTPVVTPTPTPVVTPTPTPEVTPTPTPVVTPTPTPVVTPTPTPVVTPTPTPVVTPTPTPKVTPTPNPTPTPVPTLPQTGQLWWPVPILLAGGLVMIILGLVLRRRSEYEE